MLKLYPFSKYLGRYIFSGLILLGSSTAFGFNSVFLLLLINKNAGEAEISRLLTREKSGEAAQEFLATLERDQTPMGKAKHHFALEKYLQLNAELLRLQATPALIKMRLSELPSQQSLSDEKSGWTCGIHCATRLLKSYKHSATLNHMVDEIGQIKILGTEIGVGKGPEDLVSNLQKYEPDAKYSLFATLDYLKLILASGRPVATLLFLGEELFEETSFLMPRLHWVVVVGFGDSESQLYYLDTYDNCIRSQDYASFLKEWGWFGWNSVTGNKFTDLIYGNMDQITGRNSMFWIDRNPELVEKSLGNLDQYLENGNEIKKHLDFKEFLTEGDGVQNCNIYRAYNNGLEACVGIFGTGPEHIYIDLNVLNQSYRERFWRENGDPFFGHGGSRHCSFSARVRCYQLSHE